MGTPASLLPRISCTKHSVPNGYVLNAKFWVDYEADIPVVRALVRKGWRASCARYLARRGLIFFAGGALMMTVSGRLGSNWIITGVYEAVWGTRDGCSIAGIRVLTAITRSPDHPT